MELNDIIKEERRTVDVSAIEMPKTETEEKEEAAAKEKEEAAGEENLSLKDFATIAIGAYNVISTAIYKRIEPGFDASLAPTEMEVLKEPTEKFLEQYNVKMTPTTSLILCIISINVGKIMMLKAYREQKFKENSQNVVFYQQEKENKEQQEQKIEENGK